MSAAFIVARSPRRAYSVFLLVISVVPPCSSLVFAKVTELIHELLSKLCLMFDRQWRFLKISKFDVSPTLLRFEPLFLASIVVNFVCVCGLAPVLRDWWADELWCVKILLVIVGEDDCVKIDYPGGSTPSSKMEPDCSTKSTRRIELGSSLRR